MGFAMEALLEKPEVKSALKKGRSFEQDMAAYKAANPGVQMKKGGSASARADGCCVKGKTKGKMY